MLRQRGVSDSAATKKWRPANYRRFYEVKATPVHEICDGPGEGNLLSLLHIIEHLDSKLGLAHEGTIIGKSFPGKGPRLRNPYYFTDMNSLVSRAR